MFNDQRVNIGLNLKFEARGQKVLGYSRKGDGGWEYSQRAVDLIQEYRERFPEVAQALSTRRGGEFCFVFALSSFQGRRTDLALCLGQTSRSLKTSLIALSSMSE